MNRNHKHDGVRIGAARKISSLMIVGLAALLLAASGCSSSKNDRIMASTSEPPPLNAREAKALTLAATKVLHEASRAREALGAGTPDPDEALRRVEQGLTLVHIIETAVPWNKVKTEIRAGNLFYREGTGDDGGRVFIPISTDLVAVDELLPERGTKDGGGASAEPASKESPRELAPVVERSEMGYVALFLDVSLAKEKLEAAATKLRADDTSGAKDALLAVETDGLIFEMAETELPLEEAAANLKLAEYDVSEGRLAAAVDNLTAAAKDLTAYEIDGGQHAKDAREMHTQIDALVESLASSTADAQGRGKAEEKIANWWNDVAKWLGPATT